MQKTLKNWRNYLSEEQKMIGGREAAQSKYNLVDFDHESAREIAQILAKQLGGVLGEELGRGAMGIVYEIRMQGGEGRDMVLKITQFPHEKKGYTLTRWKKRHLKHTKPELAGILPDVGKIVDTIYDWEGGYYGGMGMKVYGIPVERLEPLPDRIKEQLFGHGGKFESKEAEKEWLTALTDPHVLIPVLRQNYGWPEMAADDPDRYYTYFDKKKRGGVEFEKKVLNLPSPTTFEDYLIRWLSQIKQLALESAASWEDTRSAIYDSPEDSIRKQNHLLAKRLEDNIKIPQYPPEALRYFGIQGAHPEKGATGTVVNDYFNKLMALGPEGIEFWDTHRENVMMRPSTNEIVVSDVGLFKQKI